MEGGLCSLSIQKVTRRRLHCNRVLGAVYFLFLIVCVTDVRAALGENQGPSLWGDDDDEFRANEAKFSVTNPTTETPTESPAAAGALVLTASPTAAESNTTTEALLVISEFPSPGPTTASPTSPDPTRLPTPDPTVPPTPDPTMLPTPNLVQNKSLVLTEFPTGAPTPSTVQTQTGSPSQSPTKNPTRNPVVPQTPMPTTKPPTIRPTVAPTPTPPPTRNPTPLPSKSPTTSPTKNPTPSPTKNPTPSPSKSPTRAPTPPPTIQPSSIPTPSPSKSPTMRPTKAPTTNPSASPTRRPSVSPTRLDSSLPTPSPSISPTGIPSVLPTDNPSVLPTRLPSVVPTTSPVPSGSPSTPAPSAMPSLAPTMQPTKQPSHLPTITPSLSPSLPLQSDLIVAFMSLAPYLYTTELVGNQAIVWERVTRQHISRQIRAMDVEPELFGLTVDADIRRQYPPKTNTLVAAAAAGDGGEVLQKASFANNSLIIEFNVAISYRSEGQDHDLDELVFSAWDSPDEKRAYLDLLKKQLNFFRDIQEVTVEVEGFIPDQPRSRSGSDDAGVAAIAGGVASGVLVLLIGGFLFVRNKNNKEEAQYDRSKATTVTGQGITAEILVEPQDEVSTLGDPMFAPGGMLIGGLERDEGTATVGDDYDYTRQYRQERNEASITDGRSRMMSEDYTKSSSVNSTTMMSKLGRMGESLFADDASFEQQFAQPEERFDVVAPAGKLGMVIDTPNGGSPVVHAIKDNSVISDRVRVGDRLLSVDGDDCTAMTAMQVSKLISLKSEKPARVLIFARSSTNSPE